MAEIRFEPEGMIVDTGYNRDYHAWFKSNVPHADRKWNGIPPTEWDKTWTVHPRHFQELKQQITRHFGYCDVVGSPPGSTVKRVEFVLDYIGRLYTRESGEATASGYVDGSWSVVFPQGVLAAYFNLDLSGRLDTSSLYAVLSVADTAGREEIKKAYRRAARTYHPDHNKEPDANETFIKIQEAYETLYDPTRRAKYDGVRRMLATADTETAAPKDALWTPPVKCGIITAMVDTATRGRWIINEILDWRDQVNEFGETRVCYWVYGEDTYREKWMV